LSKSGVYGPAFFRAESDLLSHPVAPSQIQLSRPQRCLYLPVRLDRRLDIGPGYRWAAGGLSAGALGRRKGVLQVMQEGPITIPSLIPDPDSLLALQPEELAGYVLEYLNTLPQGERDLISRHNFGLYHTVEEYPQDRWKECQHALMEAWAYLEREGLVALKPEEKDWYFVTRRGREIKTHTDLEALRHASLFPKDSIHPEIAQTVYPLFLRGEYETAIFQAFKTVEV
jgi:hypothetical protein